jgi:RNA polymerase sigma-70 factor (ECF subfamily)
MRVPSRRLNEPPDLLLRLSQGEAAAIAEAFDVHRERLLHAVRMRLHPRLAARLDPDDVLQETFLAIEKRALRFDPAKGSTWVWLRLMLGRTLADIHRRHLESRARDALQEAPLGVVPGGSDDGLSELLVGKLTSPSGAAMRAELQDRVRAALLAIKPMDRELLVLRHFEDASNVEVAQLLDIPETTASSRYLRALRKLKSALRRIAGDSDG